MFRNRLASLIKPSRVKNMPDYVLINDLFNRILLAAGWPRVIKFGFLDKILRAKGDFDLTMHICPVPADVIKYRLKKLITKQRADLYSAERAGREVEALRIMYEDSVELLRKIEKGEEKAFDISLYVNIKGRKYEELDLLTKKVKADLDGIGIISKQPTFNMLAGLKSVMPLANDKLKAIRTITSSALAECFPFTSTYFSPEPDGIIFGINPVTEVPIIRNIFGFMNPNMLIVGGSGSGKSYFTKLILSRQAMRGARVMIIDPNGEYTNLVRALGGGEIKLAKDSTINPLDMFGHDFDEKLLSLIDIFEIIFQKLTAEQRSVVHDAVINTYKKKGIMRGKKSSWKLEPPIMQDLYSTLLEIGEHKLASGLRQYVDGALSFLNQQTRINLDMNPISFNLRETPKAARPLIMYMILDYVHSVMRRHKKPKMLIIDEAWTLFSKAHEEQFLLEIVKTCRKFYLSLVLLVQEIRDLIASQAGGGILANTACKVLFRQDPAVINSLVKEFELNVQEKNLLLSCQIGEGLLIADEERIPLRVVASQAEHKLITTKPDEIF